MRKGFAPALGPGVPSQEWVDLSWTADLSVNQQDKASKEAGQINRTLQAFAAQRSRLGHSALGKPGARLFGVQEDDVRLVRNVLRDAVPETDQNKGLHRHSDLTSAFAGELGARLGDDRAWRLNTSSLRIAGQLHDAGKFSGVHRYHLNDLVGNAILKQLGIRGEILRLMQPADFNIGPLSLSAASELTERACKEAVQWYARHIYEILGLGQKAIILADVCGKAEGPEFTKIKTFEQMEADHMASRNSPDAYAAYIGEKALWPSEKYAYEHLSYFAQGWLWIYRKLRKDMKERGADVEEIRKKLQGEGA